MPGRAKLPVWRDAARTLLLTATILTALGSAWGAVAYRRHIRAFYYAARMLNASWIAAADWAQRLADAGPEAAPACRLAYRLTKDEVNKCRAARSLGLCAGLPALNQFVEREGLDTPAESVLVNLLCEECVGGRAPEGVTEWMSDRSPPAGKDLLMPRKVVLRAQLGKYEVEVYHTWCSGFSGSSSSSGGPARSETWLVSGYAEVYRSGPPGEHKTFPRPVVYFH